MTATIYTLHPREEGGGSRGGGGSYSTKFYMRRLCPEVQPITLYIPFLTKFEPGRVGNKSSK